jgi:succinate dehydrogenase / fumarate reductase, cytochrome b subunit
MSWVKNTLTSSIGQKLIISLTGLGLVVFLLVHLIGNISLLSIDGTAFNEYAHFMKHNPLIKISEYGLFGMIILHVVQAIVISKKNAAARPQKYAVSHSHPNVSWTSKYMIHFGIVILAFLILHLWDFFSFKFFREEALMDIDFSNISYLKVKTWQMLGADGTMIPNLHAKVHEVYINSPIHWFIYPLAMIVVGLHLAHGFQSAFQTLGINHKKYTPAIKSVGIAYAVIIPLAFGLIPVFIKFGFTFG